MNASLRETLPEKVARCLNRWQACWRMVCDFLDVLRQLADDFDSFLKEALDVARVAHEDRCRRFAVLVVASARASCQEKALVVRDVVPQGSCSLAVWSFPRRCPDSTLHLVDDQTGFRHSHSFFFARQDPERGNPRKTLKIQRVCSKTAPRFSVLRRVPPASVFTGLLRSAVAVSLVQLVFRFDDLEALQVHSCPLVCVATLTQSPPLQ